MRLSAFILAWGIGGISAPSIAWAAQPEGAVPAAAVRISWTATPPATCLQPSEIERAAEQRLDGYVFAHTEQAWDLRLDYFEGARKRGVLLTLVDGDGVHLGTRSIESERLDCEELRSLLPVVIAMLMDPYLVGTPKPAPSETPLVLLEEKPKTPGKPRDLDEEPPPSSVERNRSCLISLDSLLGATPAGVSWGVGGACALALGRAVDLDLALGYRFPSAGSQPPRLSIQGGMARAAVCGLLGQGTRIGLCGGMALTLVAATPLETDARTDLRVGTEAWLWTRFEHHLGKHGVVRADVGALVPFVRPQYGYLDASGEKIAWFQASPVVGSAQLGWGLRW